MAKVSRRNPKNQEKYRAHFVITGEDYISLLGSSRAQKMGLITVQHKNIMNVNETVAKADYQVLP